MKTVTIHGKRLEVVRLVSAHPRPAVPAIVFLHEGLGSISTWRDFPQRIADATGGEAVVYSRCGYGRSDPLGDKRPVGYMHDEALAVLPEFLGELGIVEPILFGHSDGASIALIHAATAARPPAALIVMAPHVLVEDISLAGIARAKTAFDSGDLRARLARHHDDVDGAFRGWNDIWLDPAFRTWNIEAYLPSITCPVLAIQGEDDEYGTMQQIERIARQAPDVELLKLADCRHSPHKDQADAVVAAVAEFVARVVDRRE